MRVCRARLLAMRLTLGTIGLSLALFACGDDGGGADTDTDGASDSASTGDSQGSSQSDSNGSASSTSADPSASDSLSDSDSDDATGTDESGTDPTIDPTADPTGGDDEPVLPAADGACPEFTTGDLDFQPGETGPRRARVYFDPSTGGGGPLVFWFHGTGGNAGSSEDALDDLDAIVAMGGMLVMPYADPAAGQFPWHLVLSQNEADLHLMDEIVGCAAAGPGIDARHIHAAGFSAGGLHASQAGIRRASYIASTVPISGGIYDINTPSDAPDQVISSMIFHGGASDNVAGLAFSESSEVFRAAVEARGGYTLMCNHNNGHQYTSDRHVAFDFMMAHPFGTDPSPFESEGVPSWVPDYCE